MNFGEAIQVCLVRKYADFSGRATRSEYWWFTLFTVLVGLLLAALEVAGLPQFFSALVQLAFFLPGLAVSVRRFHDRDLSGYYILLGFVLAILLLFAAGMLDFPSLGAGAGLLYLLYFLVTISPSKPNDNQFGPAPIPNEIGEPNNMSQPKEESRPNRGTWGISGFDTSGKVVRLSLKKDSDGIVVIGRNASECNWVLEDDSVSRKHAEIISDREGLFITDLLSANGTFLNGERLQPEVKTALPSTGTLKVGLTEFMIFTG